MYTKSFEILGLLQNGSNAFIISCFEYIIHPSRSLYLVVWQLNEIWFMDWSLHFGRTLIGVGMCGMPWMEAHICQLRHLIHKSNATRFPAYLDGDREINERLKLVGRLCAWLASDIFQCLGFAWYISAKRFTIFHEWDLEMEPMGCSYLCSSSLQLQININIFPTNGLLAYSRVLLCPSSE